MDVVFFVLLWISSPSGGFSDIYGSLAECEDTRNKIVSYLDTLYVSKCVEIEMKFVKGVQQEYKPKSEIWNP